MRKRDATAKLLAAAILTGALLFSLDPITSLVAIGLELAVAPLTGLNPLRAWPLLVSAAGVLVFAALFADPTAEPDPWRSALGYALRLIAVGLPGLLVFVTIDATDLADSLMAHLRVPPRFAIGALAAFRLMPLLTEEWRQLTLARRARGIDAGWNPIARFRLASSTAFALLVGAIRRGTRLATAMDARGFDSAVARTSARTAHFGAADVLVVAVGAGMAAVSLLAGQLVAA